MELIHLSAFSKFLEGADLVPSIHARKSAIGRKLEELPGFLVIGFRGKSDYIGGVGGVGGVAVSARTGGMIEGISLFLDKTYSIKWGSRVYFYRSDPSEETEAIFKKERDLYLIHSVHEE